MKKIYTLLAVMAFAFSASAQLEYDLSVSFEAHTEGASVSGSPMNGVIIVKNEGPVIPAGDSLFFNYKIDGGDYDLALNAGFVNFSVLEEDFATGAEMPFGNAELAWAELGITVELCANVYGVGQASFLVENYLGDTDTTNNILCIDYTLPDAPIDDASIEDLSLELSNVYVAAGQLMIVNEGANDDVQANLNIVNMNGQTVQTENFALVTGTSIVELNNLSSGIYIVSIEVEGDFITRKISIQ